MIVLLAVWLILIYWNRALFLCTVPLECTNPLEVEGRYACLLLYTISCLIHVLFEA